MKCKVLTLSHFRDKQDWTQTQMTEAELMQFKGLFLIDGLQVTGRQTGRWAAGNRQADRQVGATSRFRLTENSKAGTNETTRQQCTWQLRQTDNGTKEMVQYIWSDADEGSGDRWARRVGKVRGTFNLKTVCSILLRFPGWTVCVLETLWNNVQWALRYVFSRLVGVSEVLPNQQGRAYIHTVISNNDRPNTHNKIICSYRL